MHPPLPLSYPLFPLHPDLALAAEDGKSNRRWQEEEEEEEEEKKMIDQGGVICITGPCLLQCTTSGGCLRGLEPGGGMR